MNTNTSFIIIAIIGALVIGGCCADKFAGQEEQSFGFIVDKTFEPAHWETQSTYDSMNERWEDEQVLVPDKWTIIYAIKGYPGVKESECSGGLYTQVKNGDRIELMLSKGRWSKHIYIKSFWLEN